LLYGLGYNFGFEINVLAITWAGLKSETLALFGPSATRRRQMRGKLEEFHPNRQAVTGLLKEWGNGNKEALQELIPLVYQQLRNLASICLRSEQREHTLSATALVHEAYIRLVDADVDCQDRVHFFAVSARLLRRILVDHARANRLRKTTTGPATIPLDKGILIGPRTKDAIVAIDAALERLAAHDPRKSEIVELLCFGGLTADETAAALNIPPATVSHELKMAKAWLHRELTHPSV
jgi:RNA polymerase sigma factor (TIGR02999 family)